ncbi:MAG: RHS repeat protein [Bradymonadales bacterium]|nr:MAG: RHS repeat protein [Bradymonadales bacterium]
MPWVFVLLVALVLPSLSRADAPLPNLRTLNFYLPAEFLSLPCDAQIEIRGAYNSYAGSESVFGRKWTFNYNVKVEPGISFFEIIEGDGFRNRYNRERNLEEANRALVETILVEVRKQDAQRGSLRENRVYEEMRTRLLSDRAMREAEAQRLITTARPLGPGTYYSLARGRSSLVKKEDESFERDFQDGSRQFFDRQGRLVRSEDRNRNRLDFIYQGNQLVRINDSCGGWVRLDYYPEGPRAGLIRSLTDSLERQVSFEYDEARHLIAVNGPDGRTRGFRYNAQSNMTRLTDSSEAKHNFELAYNQAQEVERKTGPGNRVIRFTRTFVGEDRNHSITEVVYFNGETRDRRETHEFKLEDFEQVSRYNAQNEQVSRTTRRLSPTTGFVASETDQQGRGFAFEYDATGRVTKREALPSGETLVFRYGDRCQFPTGMDRKREGRPTIEIEFRFDPRCNLTRVVEKEGDKVTREIELRNNDKGRPSFMIDNTRNQALAFEYWKGKPSSISLRDVGTLRVAYLPNGEFGQVTVEPHGKAVKRFEGQEAHQYQPIILSEVRAAIEYYRNNYLRPAGLEIGI